MSEKKIVANSSPIILSSKIDFFSVLKRMYHRILIPEGVYREITSKKNPQIKKVLEDQFLQVKTVQNIDKIEEVKKEKSARQTSLIKLDYYRRKNSAENIRF